MDRLRHDNCVFCDRLFCDSNEPWDTILAETRDHVVVPTKGALVPGWVLVVSKDHVICSGALEARQRKSLEEAIDAAQALVEQSFGPATLFEHGPILPGTPLGCGIDHLHVHVAPLSDSLADACTRMFRSKWYKLAQWETLASLHRQGVGYAAVKEPGNSWMWCVPPSEVRQPLRRAVACMIGMPERFDYRKDFFLPNILETVRQIAVGR
jgi:ATP adenylyltransferase